MRISLATIKLMEKDLHLNEWRNRNRWRGSTRAPTRFTKAFPSDVGDIRGLKPWSVWNSTTMAIRISQLPNPRPAYYQPVSARGLLILGAGIHGNVIRFFYALGYYRPTTQPGP